MKSGVIILIFVVVASVCRGQTGWDVQDAKQKLFSDRINGFAESISRQHYTSKKDLIRAVFKVAHRKFLKTYKAYTQPDDILKHHTFDCLSGTYFLSQVFDRLHIDYKLIETNYHIFLVAKTEEGEVLLESTDRFGGMITDPLKIREKISVYKELNRSNKNFYLSNVEIYNEVSPEKLLGLLYFNRAILSFKKKELMQSEFFLEQSWKIYDNERIETFVPILLRAIETSNANADVKNDLIRKLRVHQTATFNTLAVAN